MCYLQTVGAGVFFELVAKVLGEVTEVLEEVADLLGEVVDLFGEVADLFGEVAEVLGVVEALEKVVCGFTTKNKQFTSNMLNISVSETI